MKLRGRSSQCDVCGENATLTRQLFQDFDYEKFTQTPLSSTVCFLGLVFYLPEIILRFFYSVAQMNADPSEAEPPSRECEN